MKLSRRLQTIADMVPNQSNIIDIGCDHGLLSIYLALEKNCKVLATDININALNNAKINIDKYRASNIELKLTDGLNDINVLDNDYIIIAGMGTKTIKHILNDNHLSNNLIISSNNHIYELRKYIVSLGYIIKDEKYIVDQKKNYVIISFIKGTEAYTEIDLKYGPILKYQVNYLLYELQKLKKIKDQTLNISSKISYEIECEIKNIEKLINSIN